MEPLRWAGEKKSNASKASLSNIKNKVFNASQFEKGRNEKMPREFKKIERTPPEPVVEVGGVVEGILVERVDGDYNKTNYRIKTSAPKPVLVFGGTVLEDLMKDVNVGQYVRMTRKPDISTKNGPMKDWDVEVAE